MNCPHCQTESVVRVELNIKDFYICKSCHYTFIPSEQVVQMGRKLFSITKSLWIEWLTQNADLNESTESMKCLIHPENSTRRTRVPDFGHDSNITDCCQILHLSPSELLPVLELGAKMGDTFTSSLKKRSKSNPLKPLISLFMPSKKKDSIDSIEELQFRNKILPILKNEL